MAIEVYVVASSCSISLPFLLRCQACTGQSTRAPTALASHNVKMVILLNSYLRYLAATGAAGSDLVEISNLPHFPNLQFLSSERFVTLSWCLGFGALVLKHYFSHVFKCQHL